MARPNWAAWRDEMEDAGDAAGDGSEISDNISGVSLETNNVTSLPFTK